jgi:hypothetical protein
VRNRLAPKIDCNLSPLVGQSARRSVCKPSPLLCAACGRRGAQNDAHPPRWLARVRSRKCAEKERRVTGPRLPPVFAEAALTGAGSEKIWLRCTISPPATETCLYRCSGSQTHCRCPCCPTAGLPVHVIVPVRETRAAGRRRVLSSSACAHRIRTHAAVQALGGRSNTDLPSSPAVWGDSAVAAPSARPARC